MKSTSAKIRLFYLFALVSTIICGLSSRRFAECLPEWNKIYVGDVLWATALLLGICLILPKSSGLKIILIAVVIAFSVELSQLYQADWISEIRRTTIGGLILGRGFLWSDFVCYAIGISVGSILKYNFDRKLRKIQ